MSILNEKGIPLEKQLKTWQDIAKRPYNRFDVDNYTRTRQILMNGIEVESWNFKHHFVRKSNDLNLNKIIVDIRRIEDMQQTTNNWLCPWNQTVLDTTLAYEQVAVDLTAWLAQNEPDEYIKETFDFGLLEDFDHLYRYAQFAYILEETDPNEILHNKTDVLLGRPTQYHHNANHIRLRKHYNKDTVSPISKINILTLVSAEQQTHNFYAEHGFMYGNMDLKRLYAEICDVEEEHVTMYESLIDPCETMLEKWLIHEMCEVCNYYNCYIDESDEKIKVIWEEMMQMELGHLQIAKKYFEKYENKDAQEIIGDKLILPSSFKSQKNYVNQILDTEIDKRLGDNQNYLRIKELNNDWASYDVQSIVSKESAPSEKAVQLSIKGIGRDVACASEENLSKQSILLKKALDKNMAFDTVSVEEYEKFSEIQPLDFKNK